MQLQCANQSMKLVQTLPSLSLSASYLAQAGLMGPCRAGTILSHSPLPALPAELNLKGSSLWGAVGQG